MKYKYKPSGITIEAEGILEADKQFEEQTGTDPVKDKTVTVAIGKWTDK